MTFANPAHHITRWSVVGMEGMWVKMFDPPKASPPTPDRMAPTNPVPEVVFAAGLQDEPREAHTVQRDLLHGLRIPTWDGAKELHFMTFRDNDNDAAQGTYPGPTIRLPRGVVFHGETQGHGPPPHTIHWHGQEPTPHNDGVGHCSMEIGDYTYQWQPNFIGTYFHHCHRNTVQHFEFGLFGLTIVEPPDAYFATQENPAIPVGHCRDGKRRTAANLAAFPEFPDFNSTPIDADDPLGQFPVDPHAMTVAYDVEALWVPDDRDSVWSDLAPDARTTYPRFGDTPGVNDEFHNNAGDDDFFAFNDFNPDYWFVTGVPVPAHKGETGTIPAGITIPAELNSGVQGSQVSVQAAVGDTILIRCLDAAYQSIRVTFPVDVVIIAWDGRALGVGHYGQYTHAYKVPAGQLIDMSVARRFDALVRATQPIDSFATVEFIDTRGENTSFEQKAMTARIPFRIGDPQQVETFSISGRIEDESGDPVPGVLVKVEPASLGATHPEFDPLTDAQGEYQVEDLEPGMYHIIPLLAGHTFVPIERTATITDSDIHDQDFVAVPVEPFQSVAGWNLVAGGPASDTGGLVVFGFDGSGYQSLQALHMESGRGYWVNTPTPALLSLTITTPPLHIDLQAGWNLIGNNTLVTVSLPPGLVAWVYAGGFSSTTSLEPFQGAWVNSPTNQHVELQPEAGA